MNRRDFRPPDRLSPAARGIERAKWREYLGDLKRLAQVAADGGTLNRNEVFQLQRHVFRGAGAVAFPILGAGPRAMAAALHGMASAFIAGATADRRLAGALVGLASELDGVLTDAATAEAAGWRAQFPDT